MLFMVGAQSAIVGTAPLHSGVVNLRHFRTLEENFAAAAVVVHVIRYEYTLRPVFRAALEQEHLVVLENDLAFEFAKTGGADGQGHVIKQVRPGSFCHVSPLVPLQAPKQVQNKGHDKPQRFKQRCEEAEDSG
jgi:hypothetical protein